MLLPSQSVEWGHLQPGARLVAETSGAAVTIEARLASGGQGDVYAVAMGGRPYALKWYRPELIRRDPGLRERLKRLARKDPPSPRFLWPVDLVIQPGAAELFGYLMPLREDRFHDFDEVIAGSIRPNLRAVVTAGLGTVEEYRALHAGGWCYMDINFGNVALDPDTGEVRICDNDNADVNNAPAYVFTGTPGFMAPEIVQRIARPTVATDLWSLAVLLFWSLVRCHPLLGRREFECPIMDAKAEDRLFGSEARFIFDPSDRSNEPVAGYHDNALLLWPVYPTLLRDLFTRAFTDGIRDPRHGRVLESEWRSALAQLRDHIRHCPDCGTENFHDPDRSGPGKCWAPACGKRLDEPLKLSIGDFTVVADHGATIFPHHVHARRRFDFSTPLAEVVRHPARNDLIGLRNLGEEPLAARQADGRERVVEPGRILELVRGVEVELGAARATVV